MAEGHNYVPLQEDKYASLEGDDFEHLEDMAEDSPIYTFLRIVVRQLVGFPWHLTANVTASKGSLVNKNPPLKYPRARSLGLRSGTSS
ncbi:hypothetical protein ABVK25_004080 [Lepraria finkii]|uniref:Uncharacterized protein n=1 Tax=Lepraria finkii TaxID=1340010 RepID=A0ABR4BFP3_9LECA